MALIKCKDCGHKMSDKAKACPECGWPNEVLAKKKQEEDDELPFIYRGQRSNYWVKMW